MKQHRVKLIISQLYIYIYIHGEYLAWPRIDEKKTDIVVSKKKKKKNPNGKIFINIRLPRNERDFVRIK